MSLFEPQKIYCPACGIGFFSTFNMQLCCSMECVDELEWRRTLYIMGEKYLLSPETLKRCQENKKNANKYNSSRIRKVF